MAGGEGPYRNQTEGRSPALIEKRRPLVAHFYSRTQEPGMGSDTAVGSDQDTTQGDFKARSGGGFETRPGS